jgi:hypothetical protein
VSGARWAQNDLLAKFPSADVRVFVVWFRMYPGDEESRWPREILQDRRIIQAWDEPKAAGRWFMTHLSALKPSRGGDGQFPQRDDALWDSYLLFDRDATWNSAPTGVLSWGFTVMRTRNKLADDFRWAVSNH